MSTSRSHDSSALATALVALFFLVLTVPHTWPLVVQLGTHSPDSQDSILNIWILGATARRLVSDPVHVFDANMYYPFRWALATVDHQLANSVVAAPVTLATGNPLMGHNVFILATFVLSGLTMFLLVRSLTGSVGAGLLAGTVYTFSPARFDHLMHSHIMASFWMPAMLLAVHRYVARPTRGRLLVAVLLFVGEALASWYWAAFGAVAAGVIGLWSLAGATDHHRRVVAGAMAGGLLSFALLLPVALPYSSVIAAYVESVEHEAEPSSTDGRRETLSARLALMFQPQGHDEAVVDYSAQLQNYLSPARSASWMYAEARRRLFSTSETGLFPGVVAIALAAVALVTVRARGLTGRERAAPRLLTAISLWVGLSVGLGAFHYHTAWPHLITRGASLVTVAAIGWAAWLLWRTWRADDQDEKTIRTYAALLCLAVLLSMGLRVVAFETDLGAGMFPAHVPPFSAAKHAGRYGIIAIAALAVLAGFGLATIERRLATAARRAAFAAVCLLASNLELRAAPLDFYPLPPTSRAVRWLRIAPEGAVVEFPIHRNIEALYRSLYHRKPVVNGNAAIEPPPYRGLESHDDLSPAMIEQLRAYFHPRYVVVDKDKYDDDGREKLMANLERAAGALKLVFRAPYEPLIFELLPGGDGARLLRSYPAALAKGKRGVVMRGVVEGRREGAETAVAVTLDGRPLASWPGSELSGGVLRFVPFPQALDGGALVEVSVDYTLRPQTRRPLGGTGRMTPADIAVESGAVRSRVRINNRTWHGSKGYTLAAIDPHSEAAGVRTFNTSWYESESRAMAAYIDGLPDGTVVAVTSEYDVSRRLTADAVEALRTLGLKEDLRGRFGWAHAAIGVKGAAPGTAVESVHASETACGVGQPADLRLRLAELKLY